MKKMIVNMASRQKRYAIIEKGRLKKLEVYSPGQSSLVGNIYLGTVTKILPGMDAAFIDYGTEKNGFLHRDDLPAYQLHKQSNSGLQHPIGHFVRQGERLLVQVKRDEAGSKGAKLSGIIELSSDLMVYIKGINYVGISKKFEDAASQQKWRKLAVAEKETDEGLIIRTDMEHRQEHVFLHELSGFRKKYMELTRAASGRKAPGLLFEQDSFFEQLLNDISSQGPAEIIVDDFSAYQLIKDKFAQAAVAYYRENPNIFTEFHIEREIERARKKIVWLDHGGYLVIEETEAFTVIDVNTGKNTGKSGKEQTVFETNMEAAREAVHQLKIRNISGIILIDFINMKEKRHRDSILETVKKEARQDEIRNQVIGFTELGILQLTRKRTSPSISKLSSEPCPVCQGYGIIDNAETVAFRLERELFEYRAREEEAVWIEATPDVAAVLLGQSENYRPVLEQAAGKTIRITRLSGPMNHYHIKRFGTMEEIEQAIQADKQLD
ncbi:Rne/Rng family ribonuclease [Peribacillus sp. SCS-155]|uniref:Rne/Rng family ribonuclease n=1 Tax=Peribacillus sedimenti TaxID=3115297 RepID=UPI0039068DB3